MNEEELKERADARLEAALAEVGLEDPRPGYRGLLAALRETDGPAYEEAVRRYEEELLPAVADEEADAPDPVAAWIRYGAWLAGRLGEGRTVAVDGTGRADTLGDDPAARLTDGGSGESDALLLHLPGDDPRGGIVLAAPAEPTDPQAMTRELLCG